jgi:hypothetical protein
MPRLPGALAALLTMGVCIGFNTIRYPVVWQMVAQSNPWPPPASTASGAAEGSDWPAAAAGGPRTVSRAPAVEALRVEPGFSGPIPVATEGDSPIFVGRKLGQSPPPKTRVVCNGSMCCLVKETAPEPTPPAAASGVAKSPAAAGGAAPIAAPPSAAPEATVAAPLVPIVRPPKPTAPAPVLTAALEVTDVDHDRLGQDKVRPLPPIDRVLPVEPASPQEELPADQIPFYPSTRTRPAG